MKLYDKFMSTFVQKKKKYKPIAKKVKPVATTVPEEFHILHKIKGDLLATMPQLSPNPLPFEPLSCYTQERKELINKTHPLCFLWTKECTLTHDFMHLQNKGFVWNDHEGRQFCTDFFPLVQFPVFPHIPWVQRNFLITRNIQGCLQAYSFARRWKWEFMSHPTCPIDHTGFASSRRMEKLCIVHSLEPLNAVTIKHTGVTLRFIKCVKCVLRSFLNKSCKWNVKLRDKKSIRACSATAVT